MKLWPASLPQHANRSGYSETPRMAKASFATDSGMPIERPKGTLRLYLISCAMRMSGQQLETFTLFVERDLARGTLEFLMPHPRTREQVTAKLSGDSAWRASATGGDHWQVSLELLIKVT